MEHRFEMHNVANELAPLLILATTSLLLVGGMAFAVQNTDTAASITRSGQVIFGSLTFGLLAMAFLVFGRGRPRDVTASADEAGLVLDGKRRVRSSAIRHAYVMRDGARWSVEIERLFGSLRLVTGDQEAAERLAGRLRGVERVPPALHRLRKKAHYLLFSTTIFAWSFVFAAVITFAFNAIAGLILIAATLPVALWVTLRTVPAVVVVEQSGVVILHPLKERTIRASEIASAAVVNDDAVRLYLPDEQLTLTELANHPRDREARTSAPPAERFEASLRQIVDQPA